MSLLPWNIYLSLGGALLALAAGFMYLAIPAHSLPHFFPAYSAKGSKHGTKHGVAALVIGVVVLVIAAIIPITARRRVDY